MQEYLLLGKIAEDLILVQYPSSRRPEAMTRALLEAIWDGRLVLMAPRAKLSDLTRRFDITWFLGVARAAWSFAPADAPLLRLHRG